MPWVQAPGEGEAMAAALSAAGLVDGVQSRDADALLFGAPTVYKRLHLLVRCVEVPVLHLAQQRMQHACVTIRQATQSRARLCDLLQLQADQPRDSELAKCELAPIARAMGLNQGGALALRAAAVVAGGDYNVAGAEGVGHTLAVRAVTALLAGQKVRRGHDGAVILTLLCTVLSTAVLPHSCIPFACLDRMTRAQSSSSCQPWTQALMSTCWRWTSARGARSAVSDF